MLLARHALVTSARPCAVWALLRDPAGWSRWDDSLAGLRVVKGPGLLRGRLRRHGHPSGPFRVTRVREGRGLVFRQRLLFAELICSWSLAPYAQGTLLVCLVALRGPLAWLHRLANGRRWARWTTACARKLARLSARPEPGGTPLRSGAWPLEDLAASAAATQPAHAATQPAHAATVAAHAVAPGTPMDAEQEPHPERRETAAELPPPISRPEVRPLPIPEAVPAPAEPGRRTGRARPAPRPDPFSQEAPERHYRRKPQTRTR